ncbi:MAG: hypothetical protein LBB87_05825, partial [Nitrososphaerota archaeon]|nr:hypothetical protein [Nitrososphaerota archaeon]
MFARLCRKNILSQFTKGIFWSFDIEKLDYKRDKDLIIEQIIEAGLQNDEIIMWKTYKYEDIKNVAINMDYMRHDTLKYMSFVLKV